ncbi:MAG: hypothetical protein AAGC47_02430 [Bacteroidota bacterium]
MYKRVSTALKHPGALITLRVATIGLLASIAWFKYVEIQSFAHLIDFDLFLPILLVGFLTLLNLAAEALKYRYLFGSDEIDFNLSFKSVLSGMSVGIWTPNRAGEFIGRLKYAPRKRRRDSIGATILGSFLQGLITLLMGAIGLAFFNSANDFNLPISWVYISIGLILVACLVIFQRGPLRNFREKHIKLVPSRVFAASGFAALRYLVFTSQFVLLLIAFGYEGDLVQAYFGVFVLYLIQTYMPGSMLSELGIREVLAIFLFAPFFENEMGAVMAAFCLWLLNIGLPIASWSLYGAVKRVELS